MPTGGCPLIVTHPGESVIRSSSVNVTIQPEHSILLSSSFSLISPSSIRPYLLLSYLTTLRNIQGLVFSVLLELNSTTEYGVTTSSLHRLFSGDASLIGQPNDIDATDRRICPCLRNNNHRLVNPLIILPFIHFNAFSQSVCKSRLLNVLTRALQKP